MKKFILVFVLCCFMATGARAAGKIDISMANANGFMVAKKGPGYESTAIVTIRDTNNQPSKETTVTITWSGVVSFTATAVTGGEGKAKFQAGKVPSTGPSARGAYRAPINN